jgi:microcystin-dependent protein
MADVFTPLLQLLKQETGNNNNNWGVLLNSQVIDRLEQAIAGTTSIAVTGGTTVLTDDQARPAILVISGVLTSAAIIEVPAGRSRLWKVFNNTTGNFPLSIRVTGTVNNFTLTRFTTQDLWTDSSQFYESGPGQVPVGSSVWHWASAAPTNFLAMDGGAVSRTLYPRLFAAIGTTWGAGDGSTTFNVPNAVGRYFRHRGDIGNGVGNFGLGYVGQDVQTHNHAATTDSQGFHGHSGVTTSNGAHNHDVTSFPNIGAGNEWAVSSGWARNLITKSTTTDGAHTHNLSIDGNGSHAHNVTVSAAGGIETRPNTIVGLACIRYQ